ncbi:MAG: ABC transporter permease, partial [Deltaproteobacteria bacterium]|nr:ABC transporter permease [Deltaproteobacteria bacterium]
LSILGIVCGVMAVLSMISIGAGAKNEALRQIEQLGTRNIYLKAVSLTQGQEYKARRQLSTGLSADDAAMIKRVCQSVEDVSCIKKVSASITGIGKDILPQFIACSASMADLQNLFMRHGRFILRSDVENENKVCVIGSDVARRLGPNLQLGGHIRIGNHLFKMVGILKQHDSDTKKTSAISIRNYNEMVFIPLGMEKIIARSSSPRGPSSTGLSEIIIKIKETGQVIDAASIIRRIMEVAHHGVEDFQMVVPQELLKQSQKTMRLFNVILGAIAGISLLVGGIGIMNIMLATVSERMREIGIRRAVGATRGHIIMQFLAESVILTFSGGIFGIASGMVAVLLITTVAGWEIAITSWAIFLPLIVSVLVGISFGLYPAYRAAFMNPIAALRHE